MKWEYEIIDLYGNTVITRKEKLSGLGEEGWELIHIAKNGAAYFKRPKVTKYEDFSEHEKRVVEYLVGGKIG
jgi:hypothetical protein